MVDGKAAKAPDLYAMTPHQRVVHGIKDGLDCKFGIAVGQLDETIGQLFNKVRASHGIKISR